VISKQRGLVNSTQLDDLIQKAKDAGEMPPCQADYSIRSGDKFVHHAGACDEAKRQAVAEVERQGRINQLLKKFGIGTTPDADLLTGAAGAAGGGAPQSPAASSKPQQQQKQPATVVCTFSQALLDAARRELPFVRDLESQLKKYVVSPPAVRGHKFLVGAPGSGGSKRGAEALQLKQRTLVHEMARAYGLTSVHQDVGGANEHVEIMPVAGLPTLIPDIPLSVAASMNARELDAAMADAPPVCVRFFGVQKVCAVLCPQLFALNCSPSTVCLQLFACLN
jgi:hypothetical protein